MKKTSFESMANMGSIDRIIRIILAVVMGVLYFQGIVGGVWGTVLVVIAGLFVITSFLSICFVYEAFGICTKKEE